jgi:zinc protease
MKTIKSLLIIVAVFLFSATAFSQIDLNRPAPIDPDIRMGKLDNGLTWFIRHNKEPEKRASFYIIQNVGAILENDDQNGLAHFLEHMAFNGTENFPGKAIISSLEKHGVAFGRNINAYTSFDETVYNLSDIPVEKPGLIDTCLLILNDWSDYISLDEKEIDLERGVIAEEWRTYKNANARMLFDKVLPVVLKGSKYAIRDVIGDIDVIRSFKPETLREFYKDWYRTDLQAIVVVGDINVDEIESKIKALFSGIPAVEDPPERYYSEVPYHEETYYVLATDKEAPQTSINVIALHNSVPAEQRNLNYLRDRSLISLMNSMLGSRISELLQKENPPFPSGSIYYGNYIPRKNDAFTISATAKQNEQAKALEAIYTEAERARRFGFGKGELDRAKARNLANLENTFKQKDKISNDTYVNWIKQYYLAGEPATSADFDLEFFKAVMDGITAEEVSQRFRELMIDENRTIIVQGLEGPEIKHLTEKEAIDIIEGVKESTLTPYEDSILSESLLNEDLEGSKIVKTVPLPQFDAEEWTLGNNTRVVFRKAEYEKDNIILSAFSLGGISKVENELVLSANMLPAILPMYGAGEFDNITLTKMLAGKKAAVTVSLSETAESITGSATPADFETMMQLLYLRVARPRFEQVAHNAIVERYSAFIGNMEKSPDKIISDSVALITTGYHPRTPILTKESVGSITLDDIQEIYTDRFGNADEFIFIIVGNIDKETVIPVVEKYIGSLPSTGRKETWTDRKVRQPEGRISRTINLPLTIPKATVLLSFAQELKYNPHNYLGLEVIEGILDIVYTEKVREDEGGTYGVGISLSAQKRPVELGEALISFDCDPDRANDLLAIIYRELNDMMENGPSQENLEKTISNMLKTREENKLHNAYWSSILSRYYNYGINSDDPDNYENILKSFTVKDIKKIAGKMFKKADVVDLIFKPAE